MGREHRSPATRWPVSGTNFPPRPGRTSPTPTLASSESSPNPGDPSDEPSRHRPGGARGVAARTRTAATSRSSRSGAVYKHWPAKTVTESDDHLFCLITMNHHPLHINDVYAKQSQQGRNVVVGPLVYSLALGMSVSDVSGKAIANLATEELKHPAPVFHGDTLFCESEVLEVKPSQSKPDRGTVTRAHPRAQPGRRARGRVQAPRARARARSRAASRRRRSRPNRTSNSRLSRMRCIGRLGRSRSVSSLSHGGSSSRPPG